MRICLKMLTSHYTLIHLQIRFTTQAPLPPLLLYNITMKPFQLFFLVIYLDSCRANAPLRGFAGAKRAVLEGADGSLQTFVRTLKDARRHLAAAAAARTTSIFAMYPVDTFKVSFHCRVFSGPRATSHDSLFVFGLIRHNHP
jgi:hypothetical protein